MPDLRVSELQGHRDLRVVPFPSRSGQTDVSTPFRTESLEDAVKCILICALPPDLGCLGLQSVLDISVNAGREGGSGRFHVSFRVNLWRVFPSAAGTAGGFFICLSHGEIKVRVLAGQRDNVKGLSTGQ